MNNKQNSIETLFAKPIVNCYYNSTVEEEDNETEYIEKEDYDEDEYEEEDYEKDDLDLNPDQTMGNKYFNDWFVKNNKAYVNKYKKIFGEDALVNFIFENQASQEKDVAAFNNDKTLFIADLSITHFVIVSDSCSLPTKHSP